MGGWVGVAGLAGPDGREFWNSVKKLILKERNLSFSQQFDHQVTRKNNTKLNLQQTYHKCDVFVLYIFPTLFDIFTDFGDFVLQNFDEDEMPGIEKISNNIIESISLLVDKKLDLFSSTVNNK